MNLVFLYGPPAVGKLTVANALAELTGYKVFHNHLTLDCVLALFEFDNKAFGSLVLQIRLAILEEAARQGVDTIFTFVYNAEGDRPYVQKLCDAVERHGGSTFFVQLN